MFPKRVKQVKFDKRRNPWNTSHQKAKMCLENVTNLARTSGQKKNLLPSTQSFSAERDLTAELWSGSPFSIPSHR